MLVKTHLRTTKVTNSSSKTCGWLALWLAGWLAKQPPQVLSTGSYYWYISEIQFPLWHSGRLSVDWWNYEYFILLFLFLISTNGSNTTKFKKSQGEKTPSPFRRPAGGRWRQQRWSKLWISCKKFCHDWDVLPIPPRMPYFKAFYFQIVFIFSDNVLQRVWI